MLKNMPQYSFRLKLIIIFFIILMCFFVFIRILNFTDKDKKLETQRNNLFSAVDTSTYGNITKYSIYGTHFNIEGTLDIIKISGIKITNVNLIAKTPEDEEIDIHSDFNHTDNTVSFSSSDTINEGINLEDLSENTYYLLLKLTFSNSDIKYYSLKNSSEYTNTTHYTITKNNSNNKVDVLFNTYNNIPYMAIEVTKAETLPEDVYDIAIDPGHGGLDLGAVSGNYNEAALTLEYGLKLKTNLENLGLKVFISRDGSESSTDDTAKNMYDENGRINILNKSKAKLLLSLHINDTIYNKNTGGVEIYAPNNCNLDFASLLANNIVNYANTYYSELSTYKKSDGVYVHNFTNTDILAYKSKAIKAGYEPYNINTNTPYLFIIRETGGISTNAFVDGRNKTYGTNKYYNSNIGIEAYSIELGYMNIEKDLNNIASNKDNYINAITESIKTFYKIENYQ